MIRMSENDARDNFSETLDRVANGGEHVVIQRDGKDVATIVPAQADLESVPEGEMDDEEPLWKKIVRIGESIPREEWKKVPPDLSKNIDHYLYGSPKVE